MTRRFYNTIAERLKELEESRYRVETQEDCVLKYFENNPHLLLTPFEVQMHVLPNCPITSVRRAMTNLTQAGKLHKFPVMHDGVYGKKNHTWGLALSGRGNNG